MPKPLSHTGDSLSELMHRGQEVIGLLVYYMGDPKKIGIVRDKRLISTWRHEVLVEWMSGKKVWKYAGPMITIDSKITEEEHVLSTLKDVRSQAERHFNA